MPIGSAAEISKLLERAGNNDLLSVGICPALPDVPGLEVADYGGISLPLRSEQAAVLADLCSSEDSNVWTLSPRQIELQNPQWGPAIQQLCEKLSTQMKLKAVLQPIMSKVMILGPGAHLSSRGDQSGNTVAKLVVQFPSEYTGGDILMDEADKEDLITLNLVNTVSRFKPLYLVHGVGRKWSVEVTSGYRVMVEYSLELPSDANTAATSQQADELLQAELAEAIRDYTKDHDHHPVDYLSKFSCQEREEDGDNAVDMIALMLSTSCNASTIHSKGVEGLPGADRDRVRCLLKANAMAKKNLRFYIAELYRRVLDGDSPCGEKIESAAWYSINGTRFCKSTAVDWTTRTVLLNPGHETLSQVFQNNSSYSGQVFSRFALVGWPDSADVVNTYHFMGYTAGMLVFLEEELKSSDTNYHKCRLFNVYTEYQKRLARKTVVTLEFFKSLCAVAIADADSTLASVLLTTYFSRLKSKNDVVSSVADLIRALGWGAVSSPMTSAISALSCYGQVEFELNLADAVENDVDARKALVEKAWQDSRNITLSRLSSAPFMGQLWKHAVIEDGIFLKVVEVVQRMRAHQLGPAVRSLAEYINGSSSANQCNELVSLASRRLNWLIVEIKQMTKPFTWEIVDSDFSAADEVKSFLKGSQPRLEIKGFASVKEARAWVKVVNSKVTAPLSISASGRGANACVEIVKTGGEFASATGILADYQTEESRLTNLLLDLKEHAGTDIDVRGTKRRREADGGNARTKSTRST